MGNELDWAEELLEELKAKYFMVSEFIPEHALISTFKRLKADGLLQANAIMIDTSKEVATEDAILVAARKIASLAAEILHGE